MAIEIEYKESVFKDLKKIGMPNFKSIVDKLEKNLKKDPDTGADIFPELETMRICVSRRVYTNNHLDVVAEALGDIYKKRHEYKGMRLVFEGPIVSLRHFTAGFELIE